MLLNFEETSKFFAHLGKNEDKCICSEILGAEKYYGVRRGDSSKNDGAKKLLSFPYEGHDTTTTHLPYHVTYNPQYSTQDGILARKCR